MDRKLLARRIAEESIVLLKNEDHMLPLKEKKEIAFFGKFLRGQFARFVENFFINADLADVVQGRGQLQHL